MLLGALFVKIEQIIIEPGHHNISWATFITGCLACCAPDFVYSGFARAPSIVNAEAQEDLWNDWEPEEYGRIIRIHTFPDGHNSGRLGPRT